MGLVENAWGVFGAAFGPAIILSLFWKRFTFGGAVAGIVVGAVVDIAWLAFLSSTGIYEIIPGFVLGLIAAVVVSKCTKAPSAEVNALFDTAVSYKD
jgi:sodium/proline symporter